MTYGTRAVTVFVRARKSIASRPCIFVSVNALSYHPAKPASAEAAPAAAGARIQKVWLPIRLHSMMRVCNVRDDAVCQVHDVRSGPT
jgi:hypothetical protein